MGRTDITSDEMLRLDHLHVTRWSLVRDPKILVQTVPAVLLRENV
jgi:lipopolysaccharide/colanic/teichoic acid biosynthesis glycosyltransferase